MCMGENVYLFARGWFIQNYAKLFVNSVAEERKKQAYAQHTNPSTNADHTATIENKNKYSNSYSNKNELILILIIIVVVVIRDK